MGSGSDAISEPTIIQKTSEQVIRLREGEASIMSGMVNKTETVSWSGIPGLSSIPGLKYLFGSKDRTITEDEIVFVIVPHIVRSQSLDQVNLRTIDTGVGPSIELRHVQSPSQGGISAPNPGSNPANPPAPARTPVRTRPNMGTVPGQSAQAAAPAALEQMREAARTNGDNAAAATAPAPAATVGFTLTPPAGPLAAGVTFSIPVALNAGTDIASVPLQIQYDPAKLSLVNVDKGDFLGRDGQAWDLSHRDDGAGLIFINASRPPGAIGVNGSGVVCVLSFQAKTAGESAVTITRPGALTSKQQQVPAQGARINIQVQ
jgi:general secretion pathway protein D